jgi:hypothetical protein
MKNIQMMVNFKDSGYFVILNACSCEKDEHEVHFMQNIGYIDETILIATIPFEIIENIVDCETMNEISIV